MSASALINLAVIGLTALALGITSLVIRKRRQVILRSIPAFRVLNRMVGIAVEEGKPMHVSLGMGNLLDRQATTSFSGLAVLQNMAHISRIGDRSTLATSGDGSLVILAQDTLRQAGERKDRIGTNLAGQARLTGVTPASFISGVMATLLDVPVAGSLLTGHYDTLGALLTTRPVSEAGTLAATESITAQAAFLMSADETLLGEDVFAAPAYSGPTPSRTASLIVQDILRWLIVLSMIALIILRILGVL